MLQRICGAVVLAVAVGAGATPAWAGRALYVTLPFEFGAGNETFPGGRCKLELASSTKVSIECSGVRLVAAARDLEFMGDAWEATQVKEIIFTRYGESYFLSEVWIATEGRELLESDAEKAMIEDGVEGTRVKLKVK